MRALWITFIAIATLGSLYPFDFELTGPPGGLLQALRESASASTSRGDVAGNFILFLPIGLFGMLAMDPSRPAWVRFLRTAAISTFVAGALQVLQVFLPSRDPSLADVIWNAAGVTGGASLAGLASLTQLEGSVLARRFGRAAFLPLALIACWLAYRLLPFVPSIDLQAFKDSLKPIFNEPLDPAAYTRDAVGWTLMAYLLREAWPGARFDRLLPLMMAGVFALEVLIVSNGIDRADVAGAVTAVALWFGVLRRLSRPEWAVLALLAGTIAMGGLSPLRVRAEVAPFEWMPFRGFLGGSMYLNAQSALEKTFLYGSLALLAQRVLPGRARGVLLAMGFVGLIEFAQTRLVGHTPEITDPLLVLLAALAILVLEREDAARAIPPREARPPTPSSGRTHEPLTGISAGISAGLSAGLSTGGSAASPTAPPAAPPTTPPSDTADDTAAATAGDAPARVRTHPSPRTSSWVDLPLVLEPGQRALLEDLAEAWGVGLTAAATQAITHSLARRPPKAPGTTTASPDTARSAAVSPTGPDPQLDAQLDAQEGTGSVEAAPTPREDPGPRAAPARAVTEHLRLREDHFEGLTGLARESGQSVSEMALSIIAAAHAREGRSS